MNESYSSAKVFYLDMIGRAELSGQRDWKARNKVLTNGPNLWIGHKHKRQLHSCSPTIQTDRTGGLVPTLNLKHSPKSKTGGAFSCLIRKRRKRRKDLNVTEEKNNHDEKGKSSNLIPTFTWPASHNWSSVIMSRM